MSLTIKEKEEWKSMIANRIDQKIQRLWAAEPGLQDRIEEISRQAAEESLGIFDDLERIRQLEQEVKDKNKQIENIRRVLHQRLTGEEDSYDYNRKSQIDSQIRSRQVITREAEMLKHETSRMVQSLLDEKRDLTETVWLATGTSQVKDLWYKLLTRLQETPTPLQQGAMDIAPDNSPSVV